MSHPLLLHSRKTVPQWPSYRGVSHLVGTSPKNAVTVYADPTLGTPGFKNASDLLADADRVADLNNRIFATTGGPVSAIVFALNGATDGTGGADHADCTFVHGGAIEVCASFGSPARVSSLFEAELSECAMNGNLCGVSTGEALSRWCAAVTANNALADFASAPTWADNGMPDFVTQTENTDRAALSTGCGMAFISFLLGSGVKLEAIAQELVKLGAGGTFADVYAAVTGKPAAQAEQLFVAAVKALPGGVTSDDPFGGFANAL